MTQADTRSDAASAYLKIYNTLQMIGWMSACLLTLVGLYTGPGVWPLAGTTSVARRLHFWRCCTWVQWFGRANVVFALLSCIPEVQDHIGVSFTFVAWTLSEVVRYPWYISMLMETPSPLLTWLRYSCFIPLYPLGIIGELMVTWHALPYIQNRNLHSISMPNAVNFSFDYHTFCLVGIYFIIPAAFLFLYTYMLRQRKSRLYPRAKQN